MKKIFKFILDILFPLHCLNCHREEFWLCENCIQKLLLSPSYERFEKILVFSIANYEQPLIKKLIRTCKFSKVPEIAKILGQLLIRGISEFPEVKDLLCNEKNLLIVSIPLSRRRERERGFNQAFLIAQAVGLAYNIPLSFELKRKERAPQSKLSANKRGRNIQQAFFWTGERLTNQRILLVDDVVTTGTTIAEAAKILKSVGARRVTGITIAR
ncbi:MAG: ComF family protein [Candidatus Falkowbacteria bacterium]|nr:ComF family protein [Candidatus Falkowbacteria bacterium]